MIKFLTAEHGPVPPFVTVGTVVHPTAVALASGDTAYLALLGIFPHDIPDGFAPWGHTWELVGGIYVGTPVGTDEERSAALAQQHADTMRATVWRPNAQRRRLNAARTAARTAAATLPHASRAAVEALITLTEDR
jgi:hypothetical protein